MTTRRNTGRLGVAAMPAALVFALTTPQQAIAVPPPDYPSWDEVQAARGDERKTQAEIDKIEFMGPYCLVRVKADALGGHALTVYLSLNYLAEAQLQVGSRVPLRLMPDRMRVFA